MSTRACFGENDCWLSPAESPCGQDVVKERAGYYPIRMRAELPEGTKEILGPGTVCAGKIEEVVLPKVGIVTLLDVALKDGAAGTIRFSIGWKVLSFGDVGTAGTDCGGGSNGGEARLIPRRGWVLTTTPPSRTLRGAMDRCRPTRPAEG